MLLGYGVTGVFAVGDPSRRHSAHYLADRQVTQDPDSVCRPAEETPIVPPSLDRTKSSNDRSQPHAAAAAPAQPAAPLLLAGPPG